MAGGLVGAAGAIAKGGGGAKSAEAAGRAALGLIRNRFTPIQYRFLTVFYDHEDKLDKAQIARMALFLVDFGASIAQQVQESMAANASADARASASGPTGTGDETKKGWESVKLRFLDPDGEVLAEDPYPKRRDLSADEVGALAPGERERSETADASFAGFAGVRMSDLGEDHKLVLKWVVGYVVPADLGTLPTDPGAGASQTQKDDYATKLATYNSKNPLLTHEDGKLRIERNLGGTSNFSMTSAELQAAWVTIPLDRFGVKAALIEKLATLSTIGSHSADKALYSWISGLDHITDADSIQVTGQTLYVWHAGGRAIHVEDALRNAYQDFAVSELEGITAPQQVSELQDSTLQAIVQTVSTDDATPAIQLTDWISWSGGRLRVRTKGQRTYTLDELLTASQSAISQAQLDALSAPSTATALPAGIDLLADTAESDITDTGTRDIVSNLTASSDTELTAELTWADPTLTAVFRDATPNDRLTLTWSRAAVDAALAEKSSDATEIAALKDAGPYDASTLTGNAAAAWQDLLSQHDTYTWCATPTPAGLVGKRSAARNRRRIRMHFWPEDTIKLAVERQNPPDPTKRLVSTVKTAGPVRYGDLTDEQWKLALQNLGSVEPNDEFAWDDTAKELTRTRRVAGGDAAPETDTFDEEAVNRACIAVVLAQPALDYLRTVTSPTMIADLQDAFAADTVRALGEVSAVVMADNDFVSWTNAGLVVDAKPSAFTEAQVRVAALKARRDYGGTPASCVHKAMLGIQTALATEKTLFRGTFSASDDEYWSYNTVAAVVGAGLLLGKWDGAAPVEPFTAQFVASSTPVAAGAGTVHVTSPPEAYPEADWGTIQVRVPCKNVPSIAGEVDPDQAETMSIVKDLLAVPTSATRVRDLDPNLVPIVLQLRDASAPGVALVGSDFVKIEGTGATAALVRDVSVEARYYDLPEVVTVERAITEKVTVEPRYMSGINGDQMTMLAAGARGIFSETMRYFAEFTSVDYGGYDIGTYSFKELNKPVARPRFDSLGYHKLTFKTGFMHQDFLFNWCQSLDYGKPIRRQGFIIMLDRGGIPIRTVKFSGALPVSWTGANLDAYGDSQPIDSFEVVCDQLTVKHWGAGGFI